MYLDNIFTELKFKNASSFLDKIRKIRTLSFDIDVRYDAGSFDRTAIDGVKRQWNISAITRWARYSKGGTALLWQEFTI